MQQIFTFKKGFYLLLCLFYCTNTWAQTRISGTIRDDVGPVIGASVLVKGTSTGTQTDAKGEFSIPAEVGTTLIISYIGYTSKEITIADKSPLKISLTPNSSTLNDVVVVGYGTQKKENLTGAVAAITAKELESRPITNLAAGLQGLIPNLNINRGNGTPGTGASFNIRGNTNIAGTGPLILVDGVQMDPNSISPDDVQSVTVLKDAASAAIYGVRGAFGVVLITTKSPKKNAPVQISYSGSYTTTRPTVLPEYMSGLEYVTAHRAANRMSAFGSPAATGGFDYSVEDSTRTAAYQNDPVNNLPVYVDPTNTSRYKYVGNTDWIKELYPNRAPQTQHSLSVSGGGEKTQYVASLGYFDQSGLLKAARDNYKRYNPTLKLNTTVTPWLDLNFRTTLNRSERDNPSPGLQGVTSGWIPTDVRPVMPVRHPDGNYSGQGNFSNMIALVSQNGRTTQQTNDLFLTGGLTLKPINHVQVVANYTYNTFSDFRRQHYKEYGEYGVNSIFLNTYRWTSPASVQEAAIRGRYYSINAYANYENTFNEKHYVKLTAGYNEEYNYRNFYSVYVRNLIDQQVPAINLNNDPAPRVAGNSTEWALTGSFFRLNYSFNNRYLLEVNGRYDGTSRYQRGNRYTFLPSVSAGWRVSEEGFFKNIKNVVNDFKIRGSYGTLGNQITANANAYPYIANDFPYIPTIPVLTPTSGGYNYIFGTTQGIAVNAPGLVNPNFTWEKVTSKDLGVDISLLNSRLTATGDLYIRDTRDMLAPGSALPATLGTAVPQVNAADLRTKGWELSLTWNDRFKNGLSYSLTANLSDYQSTVTRYNGNPNRNIANVGDYGAVNINTIYQGLKLGEIWGFETDRYFTNDAEAATSAYNQSALFGGTWRAGDIRYRDLNGDGRVDFGANTVSNPGDRRVIGNTTPRYQYGFIGNVAFKGFDLNFILQGVGKRDVWLGGAYMFPFAVEEWDVPLKSQLNYWTPQNTDAYYARLRFGGGGNYQQQTKYLQNGAYLRMKNITFGYTIPSVITKRANLQRVRVYFSGENLYEITGLNKAFDPELLDARGYPLNRALSFGLQIGL